MRFPRIAIFASGAGSNAEALMEKMSELGGHIALLVSDKSQSLALQKARSRNVTACLVEKTSDRSTHELEILKVLNQHQIDWVFLAGYMRLLSPLFLRSMSACHQGAMQVVNIHPSLLPAYPGSQAIERAHGDQVSESGVTLHLVDEGMDTGPVLRQEKLSLHPFESLSDFQRRMHKLEHQMYTELLQDIVQGKIPTSPYQEVIEC